MKTKEQRVKDLNDKIRLCDSPVKIQLYMKLIKQIEKEDKK